MKRDVTVWLSLLLIVVPGTIGLAMGMPRTIAQDDPAVFHIIFWIVVAGAVRASVLWFQTLIHAVKHAKEGNRVAVVVGHVLLGPITPYAYYVAARLDAREAEQRRLSVACDAGTAD